MTVSIIIPIYNTGDALKRMLDCVLAQTYTDIEVILVDDGSTDNSGNKCDKYAETDSRVKVIHQPNGGVSSARNAGMSIAKGEYLAFLDSDDEIKEDMIERLLEAALSSNADIVTSDLICNNATSTSDLLPYHPYDKEEVFQQILPKFTYGNAIALFCPVNKLYRKSTIQDNNIHWNQAITFQEDLMFTVEVIASAKSLVYVPGAFYNYIQQAGGLCSSYREKAGEQFIYARKEFDRLIDRYQMVNLDIPNFDNAFLYNISYYIYRTKRYISDKQRRAALINNILDNDYVIKLCAGLSQTATSFDRRIASAIASGKKRRALRLIDFVHSGKAAKIQGLIAKIRH